MPLILPVEKKSLRARVFHTVIVLLLVIGSITMLYPFAITVATSFTSHVDFKEWRVVPRYFYDDLMLYRKYLEDRYGKDRQFFFEFQSKYQFDHYTGPDGKKVPYAQYIQIQSIPGLDLDDPGIQKRLADWDHFRRWLPLEFTRAYNYDANYLEGRAQKDFQRFLRQRFDNDLEALNNHLDLAIRYTSYGEVNCPDTNLEGHGTRPRSTAIYRLYQEYRRDSPLEFINPLTFDRVYQDWLRQKFAKIEDVNEAWGTAFPGFRSVLFPVVRPEGAQGESWEEFLRTKFPTRFIKPQGEHTEAYREFLAGFYQGEETYDRIVRKLNQESGSAIPPLAESTFTPSMPVSDFAFQNWKRFVDEKVPVEQLEIQTTKSMYHQWLGEHYASVGELNQAYGSGYQVIKAVEPPWVAADVATFRNNRDVIKTSFITKNYRMVWSYMSDRGRALWNTVVLVVLSVIGALTIQPMAAFALSRYRLAYKHKVLIFLIATMSFPAEVTMIPNFLLLREFHLLNTYAALILPGLVSGISVFYLKGFFDSLPRELYEAGQIDGASEVRMFREITMPLAKPILAVIGLNAFTAAYGGFMWALLICQKEEMWTLMVFLYQFSSQNKPPSAQMAAFVLAGIPTLLVFIFAQKIIMRGIIVPTMK